MWKRYYICDVTGSQRLAGRIIKDIKDLLGGSAATVNPKRSFYFYNMSNYFVRKDVLAQVLLIHSCSYCGSSSELQIEHIIPRSKGGNGALSNLTRACKRCNMLKSDFLLPEFISRIIDKREVVFFNCIIYLGKLRTAIKRKHPQDRLDILITKISKCRSDHSYFTSIIGKYK